jgi:hypothetical protein
VKQYFEKIKALETEPEKRTMALDKQAAGRFIKHGLVRYSIFFQLSIRFAYNSRRAMTSTT